MKILNTKFNGLKIIGGIKFDDSRGYFREIFLKKLFKKNKFIFWCMSKSKKNVLRGMHLQTKKSQAKFISVVKGKILDVVIDCRPKSKSFGKHFKTILSEKNCKSLLIPAGFAHGFLALDKVEMTDCCLSPIPLVLQGLVYCVDALCPLEIPAVV